MKKMRLGVLISGRGSNLQALINACNDPNYPAEIAVVVSNRSDAKGIDVALDAGIPTSIVDNTKYSAGTQFEDILNQTLLLHRVDLVVLAGFMKVLSAHFLNNWPNRVINIHPSLLPKYKGLHIHERVLQAKEITTGATVHWVTPELDGGPIIASTPVTVMDNDSVQTLADRVLEAEHVLLPLIVKVIAESKAFN